MPAGALARPQARVPSCCAKSYAYITTPVAAGDETQDRLGEEELDGGSEKVQSESPVDDHNGLSDSP